MAVKEVQAFDEELADIISRIIDLLFKLAEDIPKGKDECLVTKNNFYNAVNELYNYEKLIERLSLINIEILEKKQRSSVNALFNFLEAWKGPDDGFVRIVSRAKSRSGKQYISLSYECLDPSFIVKPIANACWSFIAMSGTLTPTEMYRDILGLAQDTVLVEYENPFPKENRLNLIVPLTTTKYEMRNSVMYRRIAELCVDLTDAIPGNSVLFFPSYEVRDNVNAIFRTKSKRVIFLEDPTFTKTERDELLEKFKRYKKEGAVMLCVSSGSYGESIDLVGDFLKGVVVVGLPLAKPDLKTQVLIDYYDKKFSKGRDYGYIMPAIIKAVQNAGRVIRSETDKGVVVFLDERYEWRRYLCCFPKDLNFEVTREPVKLIQDFFTTKWVYKTKGL